MQVHNPLSEKHISILYINDMLHDTCRQSLGKHSGTQWNACPKEKIPGVTVNQLGPGSAINPVQNWYSLPPVQ